VRCNRFSWRPGSGRDLCGADPGLVGIRYDFIMPNLNFCTKIFIIAPFGVDQLINESNCNTSYLTVLASRDFGYTTEYGHWNHAYVFHLHLLVDVLF